ncbi:MAG: hypothetical protein HY914_14675 [Desulfomonile tiedjei]|nr:hypothetical protein [Desulfomonile tiedjei]
MSLFSRPARREVFRQAAGSRLRGSNTGATEYLYLVATADDLDQSLKMMNEEIAELESRLRKMAQY